MEHQAYLTACYILGYRYHSGQWSKGYSLLCMASERGKREHSCWNVGQTMEQLEKHQLYAQNSKFRNQVAYFLKSLRKYRKSL